MCTNRATKYCVDFLLLYKNLVSLAFEATQPMRGIAWVHASQGIQVGGGKGRASCTSSLQAPSCLHPEKMARCLGLPSDNSWVG